MEAVLIHQDGMLDGSAGAIADTTRAAAIIE